MSDPSPISASMPAVRRHLVRASNSTGDELDANLAAIRARGMAQVLEARWHQIIPQRFSSATWEAVGDPRAADQLKAWSGLSRQPNLVLLGPVGSGKTSAAVVALRSAHEACKEVLFVEAGSMLASLRPDGGGCVDDYCEADRLLVDDVGQETKTVWTREQVGLIVTSRYNAELPTVVTSNFNLKDLEAHLEPHTASRLLGDGAVIVVMRGSDRRRS